MSSTTAAGPIARTYAWIVMRMRVLIILAWAAGAVAATLLLPVISSTSGQEISSLVPPHSKAVATETASARLFSVPVLSRIAVVQRNPQGLSAGAQARVVARAIGIDTHRDSQARGIDGAIPVTNALGLFPSSKERSTTAITYLFFRPGRLTIADQTAAARRFASAEIRQPDDHLVAVTGPIPARLEQASLITRALPWVEAATVLVVFGALVLYFRAPGPPLLTLGAAAVAYLVSVRVVAWVGNRMGLVLPEDLEPVIVVLLLGIVTDYSIFFLSGYRLRLAAGERRVAAAQATTADFVPIIFTAGLIVAAGTAALVVASEGFLAAFGPALAFTVLVSLLVAITLIPAALGVFGRLLYRPRRFQPSPEAAAETERATGTVETAPPGWRARAARFLTAKPVAILIALACTAGLSAAASGLAGMRLGFTLLHGLPAGSEEAVGAEAAEQGFAPGILSPTEILLRGSGLNARLDGLTRLGSRLQGLPGVAGVLGPEAALGGVNQSLFTTRDGRAARLVLILDSDPLGGPAIDTLGTVEARMAALLRESGLAGVSASYAGDTALADEAIHQTFHDLGRAAAAALAIDFLLLVIFLRGVIAPLYLLAASVLGLAAALGLTVLVFQVVLGHGEITYYVPFGAGILLLSLGSDYNVFVVGRIWEEARAHPLRDAVAVAAPRAARTITLAGIVLAASFGVLGLVPLVQFREFAFTMAVGILLDTFVLRSMLVPALISTFGRVSWWPGRPPRPLREPPGSPQERSIHAA